jgi:hypothetical protein
MSTPRSASVLEIPKLDVLEFHAVYHEIVSDDLHIDVHHVQPGAVFLVYGRVQSAC